MPQLKQNTVLLQSKKALKNDLYQICIGAIIDINRVFKPTIATMGDRYDGFPE
jgi:hypothetical protein